MPSPRPLFARSIDFLNALRFSHTRSAPALTLHAVKTCHSYETLQ